MVGTAPPEPTKTIVVLTKGTIMVNTKMTRPGLLAAAAVGTVALAVLGGVAVANAADGPTTPTPGTSSETLDGSHRPTEEALTGDVAAKVTAAIEATYPDATIERMEKDADGTSVYEAHITKADGTHATVMLDASFTITGETAMPGKGMGRGMGGRRHGGHGQPGTQQPATPSGTAA